MIEIIRCTKCGDWIGSVNNAKMKIIPEDIYHGWSLICRRCQQGLGYKKIFIICPVRSVTKEERESIDRYVRSLESIGHMVYYPPRDTKQDDPIGLNICRSNREAILASDEVHIYYNPSSSGSLFDIGMTFAYGKPITLINYVYATDGKKSFSNVLRTLSGVKD